MGRNRNKSLRVKRDLAACLGLARVAAGLTPAIQFRVRPEVGYPLREYM
jgi:hypothetical protein